MVVPCASARRAMLAAAVAAGLSLTGLALVSLQGKAMLRLVRDHVAWAREVIVESKRGRRHLRDGQVRRRRSSSWPASNHGVNETIIVDFDSSYQNSCSQVKGILLDHLRSHVKDVKELLRELDIQDGEETDDVASTAVVSSSVLDLQSEEGNRIVYDPRLCCSTLSHSSVSFAEPEEEPSSRLVSGDARLSRATEAVPLSPVNNILHLSPEKLLSTDVLAALGTTSTLPPSPSAMDILSAKARLTSAKAPLATRHDVPGRKIRELMRRLQRNSRGTGGDRLFSKNICPGRPVESPCRPSRETA